MERISYQDLPAGMFEKLRAIEDYLKASPLSKHLLELVKLRAAQLNVCAYCVDMHHKELKHLGETDLRISSLCVWQETPYFSEQERLALEFTEQLTLRLPEPLTDTLFDKLEAVFTKQEIAYLSLAISQINTWNRLMKVFQFTPGNYQVSEK